MLEVGCILVNGSRIESNAESNYFSNCSLDNLLTYIDISYIPRFNSSHNLRYSESSIGVSF